MTTDAATGRAAPATQVYQVFIKATAEQIWAAITDPAITVQYFHGAHIENTPDKHVVLGPDGDDWGSGEVFEFDPPRRLVHAWRSAYNEELGAEPASRVTWEIEPRDGGYCLLTLTHDRLEGSPRTAANVSGTGWMFVLSGLKTFVETGKTLD
ncbi:MAG: SRPBCC family protein [Hamadaea sp.]|nr:SRPBCC family protein [Hamadaea sp.]